MFKNILTLLTIILKNLKIVIRSPSSLLLLVLGPLVIILLVGFAFGGDEVHDVNIGIVSNNADSIAPITDSLASEAVIVVDYRGNLNRCTMDLKLDRVQVCAEFSDDFTVTKTKVLGKIVFYYDNSRYNLAAYLSEYIKGKIAITSEQITLEAATNILNDIEDAVMFMEEARVTIDKFIENIITIRDDLAQTKIELQEINEKIDPLYEDAVVLQQKYHENEAGINSTVSLLHQHKTDMLFSIMLLDSELNTLKANINATLLNPAVKAIILANPILNTYIDLNNTEKTVKDIEDLQSKLKNYSKTIEEYDKSVEETNNELSQKIDSTVQLIADMKVFIDEASVKIDSNIVMLNEALIELNQIKAKLDENIDKFSGFDESQAQSLIKPISSRFEGLLQGMTKVNLVFPVVLVFIIMFISILLSNITVLNEINSPSYFRNFLVPIKDYLFVTGMYVTNMIVVFFQIGVLLIMAKLKFNINLLPVLSTLLIIIFLITSIFVLLGMAIAYFVKKQQNSILISTFTALALFLFSDVIFPPEVMPKLASMLAKLNPMVVGERMVRKVIYHNISLGQQSSDLWILIGFAVFMVILVLVAARKNKKRS